MNARHRVIGGVLVILAAVFAFRGSPNDGVEWPVTLPLLKGKGEASLTPGEGAIVLGFWSSWCSYCDSFLTDLSSVVDADSFPERSTLVLVGVSDGRRQLQKKLEDYPSSFGRATVVLDWNGELMGDLGLQGLPAIAVVDPTGEVAYSCQGCQGRFPWLFRIVTEATDSVRQRRY